MAAVKRRYPNDEFAKCGDAIFEKEVRAHREGNNPRHFPAIDIETGAFEIDESRRIGSTRIDVHKYSLAASFSSS